MTDGKRTFLGLAAVVAVAAVGVFGNLLIGSTDKAPLSSIVFEQPRPIGPFALIDQNGRPFRRDDLKGQWTFVHFGYTYCPDICPLTLDKMNAVDAVLQERGLGQDHVYMVVSLDPKRDTPERLKAYVTYFNPKFKAAVGTQEEVDRLAKQAGVIYKVIPGRGEYDYTLDHPNAVVVFDPNAEMRAVLIRPSDPETVVVDILRIRNEFERVN